MNLVVFNGPDPSGRMSKESFLISRFPEEYDYIIEYCNSNNIDNVSFKEKVYLAINKLDKIPTCLCGKSVRFKNTSVGYLKYCSLKCVSSDPDIKKKKEEKSMLKYGTKTPAESKVIKDKIIKTNQDKYGYNSAMCLPETQEKAKITLLQNYGVDNPNKSVNINKKRIDSFKLSNYKESYKKTSIERYGVEHPWMNKNIHSKTIDHFYDDYRIRINDKINKNDFTFIGFEKQISTNLLFNCNKCGNDFKIITYQFYYRINNRTSICTNCFPISENASITQIEMYNFIKENYDKEVLIDCKSIISPYEVDIYLPDIKIGFEFNGLWWHSSKFKNETYHLNKKELAEKNGIKLYTIWEDDWSIKREICKSYILNKLGKSNKIMGRKCKIRELDYNTSKKFLNNNHFQGDCKSSIRLGLFYDSELVSLMTFSKLRLPMGGKNKDGSYELTRFCNKTFNNVIGGASKLLKYFINKYTPIEIETYSDNLISGGDMYQKLGFEYSHTSKPGYWYVIDEKREHRFNWRKSKLKKLGGDMSKSENEIMEGWGFYKIYNAGNKKWIYKTTT
jgi:hypothetical protein